MNVMLDNLHFLMQNIGLYFWKCQILCICLHKQIYNLANIQINMENHGKAKTNKVGENSTYFIDYIYDNPSGANFYHQLVRRVDNAILYANPNLDFVFLFCFKAGISKNDIVIL